MGAQLPDCPPMALGNAARALGCLGAHVSNGLKRALDAQAVAILKARPAKDDITLTSLTQVGCLSTRGWRGCCLSWLGVMLHALSAA